MNIIPSQYIQKMWKPNSAVTYYCLVVRVEATRVMATYAVHIYTVYIVHFGFTLSQTSLAPIKNLQKYI